MNENLLTVEYLTRTDTTVAVMLNTLYDGVYIVNNRMGIIFWNKGAEQITGFSAEEVMGHFCSDDILNHIDENGVLLCSGNCPLRQTFRSKTPTELKVFPKRKCGGRVPVMTHIAPIFNEKGETIAAIEVFRDISKEEDLRILQEKFSRHLSKYVSNTTIRTIHSLVSTDREVTHPKKRDLTILYLDVVGFTPYSERTNPIEVVEMLNGLFTLCSKITEENHGDIDKFIGDAVMAVFISADDAVNAAEAIIQAVNFWNIERSKQQKELVNIRIGINSGLVLHSDIGSDKRKDLTVIGDAVNVTARIESIAKPNTVTISEATYARLSDSTRFHSIHKLMLKGKKEPIEVFEIKERL